MLHDIILVIVGFFVGAMNAIAGGGILLGFPVMLALGAPALVANATSSIVVLPGALSSAYGYRNFLKKVSKHHLFFLIPIASGGLIGSLILRNTSYSSFADLIPGLILFAVILFAFQPLLHFHIHQHLHAHPKYHNLQYMLVTSMALFPLGVYGGFFGAGFGFILLAFLGLTSIHDTHQMNALKSLASATLATGSILCLFSSHLINWHFGLLMACGSALGGYTGARFAQKVPVHTVRIIIIVIGLSTTAYLGLRTY